MELLQSLFAAIWHSQLLGVIVGAFASGWWQRRQWTLDAKRNEYRELLSALSISAHTQLQYKPWSERNPFPDTEENQQKRIQAYSEGRSVIEDRIFIAQKINQANILSRWHNMSGARDVNQFLAEWTQLRNIIVAIAYADLKIKL